MPIINLPLPFVWNGLLPEKLETKKNSESPNLSMSWCYTAATIGTTTRFAGEDLNDKVRVGGFFWGTKNENLDTCHKKNEAIFMKIREFRFFLATKGPFTGKSVVTSAKNESVRVLSCWNSRALDPSRRPLVTEF